MLKAQELVFPSVAAIKPYVPGRPIEEVQRELRIDEPAKLASNENPLGPSPLALKAIQAALASLNRYPDGSSHDLVHKLSERLGFAPEHIFMGSGSCEILNLLAFLFLRPGLNAVVARHSFVIYELAIAAAGGSAKVVPLRENFEFDLDAMADAIDANTRLVYLGNPNNPTGTIYRRREWERFLKQVPEHVVVVADEAYFEFVRDPGYPNSLEYHDDSRMLVTLRTFSKIFGLAGLRVGYAVARPDIIQMLQNVRQPFNVTSLGQVAVMAGMNDQDHVQRTLEVNSAGMDYFEREFRALGIAFVPSHANFVLAEVGRGSEMFERLLREGVIVRPMDGYQLPRHVRISVGLEAENRKLIAALRKIFKKAA